MYKVIPTNGTSAEDIKYANTVKKVYIDGIDVSECSYCLNNQLKGKGHAPAKSMPYAKETSCIACKEDITRLNFCKNNPNCYYKQLKRLQAENERLKEENKTLEQFLSKEPLALQALQKGYVSYKKSTDVFYEMVKTYKQTLQEIKEMVSEPCIVDENCQTCNSGCMQKDILDKINSVIGAE